MSAPAVLDIVTNWPPLKALVAQGSTIKVFPANVPEGTELPYIAYAITSLQPIPTITTRADADYVRLTFECYGKTREDAITVADALRDAFDHGGKQGRPLGYLITGMLEQFEPESRCYFVAMEWGLWQGRSPTPGALAPSIP